MASKRFTCNKEDLHRVLRNALVFSAPALLVFITTFQATGDFKTASVALQTWAVSTGVDLLRKFVGGK